MNKSTKEINQLAEDFMLSWLQGWPDYYCNNIDDYPSILLIAEKCYSHFKIRLWSKDGINRVKEAIVNIAIFCRYNDPWASKNLRYINLGFQRLFNQMAAAKRLSVIQSGSYNYKK